MTSRRDFLERSVATLGAAAAAPILGLPDARSAPLQAPITEPTHKPAPASLKILILGGTGFIGPKQVSYAVARGHKVTVFNRGRRQTELPDSVAQLQGDRNTGTLDALKGKSWDVVIDNPTTLPFWVRDAGQILKDSANQYIFISTISTYAHYRTKGMDESYELAKYTGTEDPMTIKQSTGGLYGPLKVLSEREAEKWFPGKTTIVRPGLIVGPGDETDRFTYWPQRIAKGGEVLAPGTWNDPVQIIDARDLSEFVIRLAEDKVIGTFNATGPRSQLSIGEMLAGCRAALSASNNVSFTWAPQEFLAENKVNGWSHMPVWIPNRGDNDGWSRVSIEKAVAAGLTFRPLATTVQDLLRWWDALPAERRNTVKSGITAEREKELLTLLHARKA